MSYKNKLEVMFPVFTKVLYKIKIFLSSKQALSIFWSLFIFSYTLLFLFSPIKKYFNLSKSINDKIEIIFFIFFNFWIILFLLLLVILFNYLMDLRNKKLNFFKNSYLLLLSFIFPVLNTIFMLFLLVFSSSFFDYFSFEFFVAFLIFIFIISLHFLYIYILYKISTNKEKIRIINFYNSNLAILLYYFWFFYTLVVIRGEM